MVLNDYFLVFFWCIPDFIGFCAGIISDLIGLEFKLVLLLVLFGKNRHFEKMLKCFFKLFQVGRYLINLVFISKYSLRPTVYIIYNTQ